MREKKRNRKKKKKREERSICTTNPLVAVISYTRPHVVELCRPYYHHHRFAPRQSYYSSEQMNEKREKTKVET